MRRWEICTFADDHAAFLAIAIRNPVRSRSPKRGGKVLNPYGTEINGQLFSTGSGKIRLDSAPATTALIADVAGLQSPYLDRL